jgi:hypothetical protein
MNPIITVANTCIRDNITYRLIYDPVYQVWSIYRQDLEVWQNDDGMATYRIYLAMLEEAIAHGS